MKTLAYKKTGDNTGIVALLDGDQLIAAEASEDIDVWLSEIGRYEAVGLSDEGYLDYIDTELPEMTITEYIEEELELDLPSLINYHLKGGAKQWWIDLIDKGYGVEDAVIDLAINSSPAEFVEDDEIEMLIKYLVEQEGLMSENELRRQFEEDILPDVIKQHGWDDDPAISEAYNDWVDALERDGEVAAYTAHNMDGYGAADVPSHLKTWGDYR